MFGKTTGIALGLISALALGIPSAEAIHIGVSPPRVEVKIKDKSRSKTIKIANFDKKPVEMRAYVRSWTVDKDGKLQLVKSTPQTLDRWIVFTPSRFTIPPGGTQTVRFAVRPKLEPNPGEHRAMLYFEEIPREGNRNSKTVRTVGRLGVAIYAYAGEVKKVGVLNSVNVDSKPDGVKAIFDVSNKGNARVEMKGQYAIWPAAKYPGAKATQALKTKVNEPVKLPQNMLHAGRLNSAPVLGDTRRQLVLPIRKKLPPGNYVLDINGELGGVPIDKGIPFTVRANAKAPNSTKSPITSSTK
ncbi:MAG: fimbria/pilus periplasmic chaperone [Rivularia sp. (in: Bacteria)]|nr:fimbria/pilus periplasmic chaperone [Rivularia sp. MS3]